MLERILLGLGLSLVIAVIALRRRSLAPSGALAALVIGTGIYAGGGGAWFAALVLFFVSSTLLGRVGRARKAAVKESFEKGDTRDAKQALSNGGVALLCALGSQLWPTPLWSAAFLGALATANADTWATEIGVLSRGEPWSLRRLARVPRGTSGAVSGLGLLATSAGALAVGVLAALSAQSYALPRWLALVSALVPGVLGSLTDSALGASLQAGYRCRACDAGHEGRVHRCGSLTEHVSGLRWFDNDAVNLAATAAGALFGALAGAALY